MTNPDDKDRQRDAAAAAAVVHIQPGMFVGLGSGDTASRAIRLLGERVKEGLQIRAVATSEKSALLARSLGIAVYPPDETGALDVTIDGADEIDPELRLIKGGGAAQTREKLVAHASAELIIVADAAKKVRRLGDHMRLPVEVLPFGARWTMRRLRALDLDPVVRDSVVTDNGNLIVDCKLTLDGDVHELAKELDSTTGVVEHGLFLDEASLAYVGVTTDDGPGVERLARQRLTR